MRTAFTSPLRFPQKNRTTNGTIAMGRTPGRMSTVTPSSTPESAHGFQSSPSIATTET